MYARLTAVRGSPDKVDAGIASFNEQVLPTVKAIDGFRGALLLVDRSSGKGVGITLWDTEDARQKAGQAVEQARAATIQTMGSTVPPVEEYEVVVSHL